MFITKVALPRRTFLYGLGTTLALPFLDAMVPALAAAPKGAPRFTAIYFGNGANITTGRLRPRVRGSTYP